MTGIRPGSVDAFLEPDCAEEQLVKPSVAPFAALIRSLEEEHERSPRTTEAAARGALGFLKIMDVHLTPEEWRDHLQDLRERGLTAGG